MQSLRMLKLSIKYFCQCFSFVLIEILWQITFYHVTPCKFKSRAMFFYCSSTISMRTNCKDTSSLALMVISCCFSPEAAVLGSDKLFPQCTKLWKCKDLISRLFRHITIQSTPKHAHTIKVNIDKSCGGVSLVVQDKIELCF